MMSRLNPFAVIFVLAAMFVLLVQITVAGAMLEEPSASAPEEKASSQPWADYIVVVDKPATAYAPNGTRIALPAGTEIDACLTPSTQPQFPDRMMGIEYNLAQRAIHVPEPCAPRPLFADGFE